MRLSLYASAKTSACISEAVCLCFIFLHDLLSSSLNPAQGALVYESSKGPSTASNLPPNFSCLLCSPPQIRAQVTHHPPPSELAMHRVHGPRSPTM
ncbi:hypothetical protein SORBI_3007G046600 [Sorghum bicolor]|uniref:Uncharacterized protein n=1 Tax=Sorghum bicolor TaxID=4558 RepID=A0A1B6PFL2_SORBI|nr:hypothetical protein SORBI_3007G046600 [Sorghum bicolor]